MWTNFSIRQMLIGVAAFAFIASLISGVTRGSALAFGLGIAILFSIVPILIYALMRIVAILLSFGLTPTGYDPVTGNANQSRSETPVAFPLNQNEPPEKVRP